MSGALEDAERRIDQARMEAEAKKLKEEQEKARKAAQEAQKKQNNNSWI